MSLPIVCSPAGLVSSLYSGLEVRLLGFFWLQGITGVEHTLRGV